VDNPEQADPGRPVIGRLKAWHSLQNCTGSLLFYNWVGFPGFWKEDTYDYSVKYSFSLARFFYWKLFDHLLQTAQNNSIAPVFARDGQTTSESLVYNCQRLKIKNF
jgi:hypothetical protein